MPAICIIKRIIGVEKDSNSSVFRFRTNNSFRSVFPLICGICFPQYFSGRSFTAINYISSIHSIISRACTHGKILILQFDNFTFGIRNKCNDLISLYSFISTTILFGGMRISPTTINRFFKCSYRRNVFIFYRTVAFRIGIGNNLFLTRQDNSSASRIDLIPGLSSRIYIVRQPKIVVSFSQLLSTTGYFKIRTTV